MKAATHDHNRQITINLGNFLDNSVAKIIAITTIIGFVGFLVNQTIDYRTIKKTTQENAKQISEFRSFGDSILKIQKDNQTALLTNQEHIKRESIIANQIIFERLGVMTWESGPDGTTTKVSNVTCKKLFLLEDDLKGTEWLNRVPYSERAGIMAAFKECIIYKRDFEYIYTFKNGLGQMIRIHAVAKYAGYNWLGTLEILK